jgi:hypothetical protein
VASAVLLWKRSRPASVLTGSETAWERFGSIQGIESKAGSHSE